MWLLHSNKVFSQLVCCKNEAIGKCSHLERDLMLLLLELRKRGGKNLAINILITGSLSVPKQFLPISYMLLNRCQIVELPHGLSLALLLENTSQHLAVSFLQPWKLPPVSPGGGNASLLHTVKSARLSPRFLAGFVCNTFFCFIPMANERALVSFPVCKYPWSCCFSLCIDSWVIVIAQLWELDHRFGCGF